MQISPRVVVAVLTYRRPVDLARTLPLLVEQARTIDPAAEVVVVDNDPCGGARDFVTSRSGAGARYVHEPVPGIAAARNRALAEAGEADALVFIDDDEEPLAGWLAALVQCWSASAAAAVTGPVEPSFATTPDAWIRASTRFERRRHDTGTVMRSAASNNLLLDLGTIRRLELRFDPSFGLTGGEDTTFTQDLALRGGLIIWCDEAVVRDHVPAARLTRSWVLRREFRSGTSWTRMRLRRTPAARRPLVRADLVARGAVRTALALARWGWGGLTGNLRHRARGTCLAAGNLGLVAGALGYRYREYRR